MQSRQHGAQPRVDDRLSDVTRERRGHVGDVLAEADVGDAPVEQSRLSNQHAASRDSISSRTWALSAPSSWAGSDGSAGARGWVRSTPASGRPAYVAATADIATSMMTPPPDARASSMAAVAASPLRGSAIASPQNTGQSPRNVTSPPATAASSPKATQSGWMAPYPLRRNHIRPGRPGTCSAPSPRRASAAGRDPSITTSAARSSCAKSPE